MLKHIEDPGRASPGYADVVNTTGNLDYVKDGRIRRNMQTPVVMVSEQGELASALGSYPPGTIAHTAGFSHMWQKTADGTWAPVY